MIFYAHERSFGCRVREYTYRGLRTLSLENEFLRAGILADKGAVRDGSARTVAPGETVRAWYTAVVIEGTGEIAGIAPEGRVQKR